MDEVLIVCRKLWRSFLRDNKNQVNNSMLRSHATNLEEVVDFRFPGTGNNRQSLEIVFLKKLFESNTGVGSPPCLKFGLWLDCAGGNNRGRFQSGGGGYRNENFRRRENYDEGRPFGNGNGRNDYVNRYVSGQVPPRGPWGEAPPSRAGRNGEANGRVYQNGAGGREHHGGWK